MSFVKGHLNIGVILEAIILSSTLQSDYAFNCYSVLEEKTFMVSWETNM